MPRNDRLYDLMDQLDHTELLFLLKNGLGIIERKYERYPRDRLKDLISSKLRQAASHSFSNFFRLEHEFPYRRILTDVAEKLSKHRLSAYQFNKDRTEEEIEKEILRLFELKTKAWLKKLSDAEKEDVADKISRMINTELVNSINKKTYIKHRIIKELKDSVITKGVVVGMLAISTGGILGFLGGSVLSQIGWSAIGRTMGLRTGIKILTTGIGGFSGIATLNFIGAFIAGLAVFVPSTIYFYADTNDKKTIPTVVMLLSKVHLNKTFGDEIPFKR